MAGTKFKVNPVNAAKLKASNGATSKDQNAVNGSYGKNGAWTDNEMLTDADRQKIEAYRAGIGTKYTGDEANTLSNQIRRSYGYAIDKQGNVTNLTVPAKQNGNDRGISNAQSLADLQRQYGDKPAASKDVSAPVVKPVSGGNQSGGISSLEYGAGSGASQYIRDMYAQQKAAQLAALKSAYEQNVLDYQAQEDLISAEAQRQRNQAAAQNDLQRMYMNELGIMQGLNTGTTGQMALAQSAALQGNLASIGTQEQKSLSDSALERSKLKAQYSAAVDQAVAQNNYELANALYQEYVRQDNLAQQKAAAALEQQNWLDKFNYQKEQDAMAQQNWQAQFDYQKEQDALDYKLALQKLNASGGGKKATTLTYSQMKDAIDRGNLTPNVLSAYKYYMGADYGSDQTTNPGTYQVDTSKLSAAGRGLWNIIKQLGDNAAAASGRVQTYLNDGRISEQEADIIMKYFGY